MAGGEEGSKVEGKRRALKGGGNRRTKDRVEIEFTFAVGGTTFKWVLVKGQDQRPERFLYIPHLSDAGQGRTATEGNMACLRLPHSKCLANPEQGKKHDLNRMQAGMHVPVSGKDASAFRAVEAVRRMTPL